MELPMVQAKYEYEYMSGSGVPAKMSPGDLFTLLRKSNSDWWYVKREGENQPVYLPATYLEIPPDNVSLGLGNLNAKRNSGNLIPHARIDTQLTEQLQIAPNNAPASHIKVNNIVSEMADRLQHRVVIPKPDYENVPDPMPRQRPNKLSIQGQVNRQSFHRASTPLGGAVSPMTDSESSSHSGPSSQNTPNYFPPPPHETKLHPSFSDTNLTSARQTVPSSELVPSRSAEVWEEHKDDKGRKYYYNPSSNKTTWEPPILKNRSPSNSPQISKKSSFNVHSLPAGWREAKTPSGEDMFINDQFKEKWYKSQNDQGETYYYSQDREETCWQLPTEPANIRRQKSEETGDTADVRRRPRLRAANERASKTQSAFLPSESQFLMNVHRRSSEADQSNIHPETTSSEREGYLFRARPGESTRKIKWQSIYTVLMGSSLGFYKDDKVTSSTPVMLLDLWGTRVIFHNEKQSKYLKKSHIELKTDKVYLLQGVTEEQTHLWYTAIHGAVSSMPLSSQRALRRQSSNDEAFTSTNDAPNTRPTSPPPANRSTSPRPRPENLIEISKSRADRKKIKNKLKSFITKRPTMESLQKQGIMKEEDVFGRHIQALCQQQGTLVPRFVTDCIALIDKSALHVDGIYRVSGNLSLIQKLRFLVDQDKPVDFNASPWKEDIHVIAGALKLYFRELPEPLVTFDGYDGLMAALKKPDRKTKLRAFQDVVSNLPRVNQETMKALFGHLNRVVDNKDKNRMLPQNLAIVFGPTLMWPKKESFNVALSMVYQNQCIEFIIREHQHLFK